jgi:ribosomal protein S18 acetylase RimI-like enzyme
MIRNYKPSDLQTLRQITAICFEKVSIDKNIEDRFGRIGDMDWEERKMSHIDDDAAANPDGLFVAEVEAEIAGYITTRLNHSTRIGGIPNLAVLPQFQRRGIGRRLIEKALAYLQAEGMLYARIETLEQNPIGTSFYPAMGFTEVARQIHYIQPLSKSDVR